MQLTKQIPPAPQHPSLRRVSVIDVLGHQTTDPESVETLSPNNISCHEGIRKHPGQTKTTWTALLLHTHICEQPSLRKMSGKPTSIYSLSPARRLSCITVLTSAIMWRVDVWSHSRMLSFFNSTCGCFGLTLPNEHYLDKSIGSLLIQVLHSVSDLP